MNQVNHADLSKLVSKLNISLNTRYRRLKNIDGPEGRLRKLRKTVTALFKYERIELYYNRADEARGYAERLLSDAIRYGDCHKPTMEMADFWLLEKQVIHKLFKVLVPRYQEYTIAYTRMLKAPRPYPGQYWKRAVLELRGNPFPPLSIDAVDNRNLIHNILLDEARKEYRARKYAEMAEKLAPTEVEKSSEKEATVMMAAADLSPGVSGDITSSETVTTVISNNSITPSETLKSVASETVEKS